MNFPELHTILYVEDNPRLRAVARMALEVIGRFTVRDCCSMQSALLAAADFEPDLILLDVQLPEEDGLATLARLRRFPHLKHTPAMFVAGQDARDDGGQLLAAGAIGVLANPVEPMRLAAQLRQHWELHWRGRQRAPDVVFLPVLR